MSVAEEPGGRRALDRGAHRRDRLRIFAANVDEAARGADREPRDRHALDQHVRIALHDHPIRERARVALVRIADDVLLLGLRAEHGLPLDAGRERRAAASAQARIRDGGDDLSARHVQRVRETPIAAVRAIVVERQRVDHADAREREPRLLREVIDLLGGTERQLRAGRPRGNWRRIDPRRRPCRRDRTRAERRRPRPRSSGSSQ